VFKKGGTFREHVYKYMTIPRAQERHLSKLSIFHTQKKCSAEVVLAELTPTEWSK